MGRKSMYCVFHSLEGSGNQNRNGIQCGFVEGTNESKCKAFQAYGFASRGNQFNDDDDEHFHLNYSEQNNAMKSKKFKRLPPQMD